VSEIFRTRALGEPIRPAAGGGWIPAISCIDLKTLDRLIQRLRLAPEIVAKQIAAGLDQSAPYIG
jgi:hypothetical protein